MFLVGHLALGYLSGRVSSKILNVNVNVPLLFLVSILPDIDLLIPGLRHRGPTHSLIVFGVLFLPVLIIYKRGAIPYFLALAQHSLIGDYLTERGVQILWPMSRSWYDAGISVKSLANISLEWVLFLTSLALLFKTGDTWSILEPHPSNLILFIPVAAICLFLLGFSRPVPTELMVPHLTYLAIFSLSILMDLKFGSKAF